MEIKDILTLIDAVSASKLTSFSYEEGEVKLFLEAARAEAKTTVVSNVEVPAQSVETTSVDSSKAVSGKMITSPMVGTFYSASSEDGEPFVTVGEKVTKGQVVGIVEAMKLMNEIESPYDGVVEEILVNNKDMVGFGQNIIRVRV